MSPGAQPRLALVVAALVLAASESKAHATRYYPNITARAAIRYQHTASFGAGVYTIETDDLKGAVPPAPLAPDTFLIVTAPDGTEYVSDNVGSNPRSRLQIYSAT